MVAVSERAFISAFPRPIDDPLFRVAEQARKRAERNGRALDEQHQAATRAVEIMRGQPFHERSHERAVTEAAGALQRSV